MLFQTDYSKNLLCITSLTCALHGSLVLTKVDECSSQPRPVGDAREKQLSCLIQLVVETFLSDFQNIGNVRKSQEVLHVVQAVRLRVGVRELRVDLRLAQRLARHLQIADKVVMLAGVVRDLDDLGEVGRVLCLDVRI